MKTNFKEKYWPYIQLCRLNKPIGIWLLFFPCLWAFVVADQGIDCLKWILVFFIGSVIMRGAGCTYNDLIDRKIDQQVERTKNRPLANNQLSPVQATKFLIVQLLAALAVACILPLTTYSTIIFSLILVFLYPWMKRITYWPQLFLAITYNVGIFMVWKVFDKPCTFALVLLYLAGVFWTIGYDTIYSFQDWQDDQRINIKSTGLRFLQCPKIFLSVIYTMVVLSLSGHGYLQQWSFLSYGIGTIVVFHYAWQIFRLDPTNIKQCQRIFLSNVIVGCLITLSLFFAKPRF